MELCMTLSSVTNTALAQNKISQQKAGTAKEQTEQNKSNTSSENNLPGNKFDDNVTLSQTEKTNESSTVIDGKEAGKLLPQVMKSILANSQMALSTQANTSPETARTFLAEA